MPLLNVRAAIECDGCGSPFRVEIDPAATGLPEWSIADFAEDAVRGGEVVPEPKRRVDLGSCSVQADKLLCPVCTAQVDADDEEA